MNIETVAQNLKRTINGKEMLLESYKNPSVGRKGVAGEAAMYATIQFLEANIDELNRILQDVEQCVAKDVEQSWRDNPDRMGGQFTQDEINRAGEWR